MQRMFTRDVGRFGEGDIKDWPKATWDQLAASVGEKVDKFTRQVHEAAHDATRGQKKALDLESKVEALQREVAETTAALQRQDGEVAQRDRTIRALTERVDAMAAEIGALKKSAGKRKPGRPPKPPSSKEA